jgi:hypothetical protein
MSCVQGLRLRSFRLLIFLYFKFVTILKKINKNASILNVTSFMTNITHCEMYLNFVFCWPCISTYSCIENQLDALFTLSIFRQSASTCFGCIYSQSSGGTPSIHNNWHLLFVSVDFLLSWLGWDPTKTTESELKRTVSTSFYIYKVYLLMMDYKYARNM